jgi:hypothetical protein
MAAAVCFRMDFKCARFRSTGLRSGLSAGRYASVWPAFADEGLNGGAFVERRVVHDKNGARR